MYIVVQVPVPVHVQNVPVHVQNVSSQRPSKRASVRPRSTVQGYLAHKKQPPPQDRRRSLGIVLRLGPTEALFLMSEVPLYMHSAGTRSYDSKNASTSVGVTFLFIIY